MRRIRLPCRARQSRKGDDGTSRLNIEKFTVSDNFRADIAEETYVTQRRKIYSGISDNRSTFISGRDVASLYAEIIRDVQIMG